MCRQPMRVAFWGKGKAAVDTRELRGWAGKCARGFRAESLRRNRRRALARGSETQAALPVCGDFARCVVRRAGPFRLLRRPSRRCQTKAARKAKQRRPRPSRLARLFFFRQRRGVPRTSRAGRRRLPLGVPLAKKSLLPQCARRLLATRARVPLLGTSAECDLEAPANDPSCLPRPPSRIRRSRGGGGENRSLSSPPFQADLQGASTRGSAERGLAGLALLAACV